MQQGARRPVMDEELLGVVGIQDDDIGAHCRHGQRVVERPVAVIPPPDHLQLVFTGGYGSRACDRLGEGRALRGQQHRQRAR